MKRLLTAVLFLIAAGIAGAQTATFTFGSLPNPFLNSSKCASMTSWNGIAATDPNNPFPLNMGDICLQSPGGIEIPYQLGFPNNGYLQECTYTPSALVDNGDGTAIQAFTLTACYDGGNTIVQGTANLRSVSQTTCGRFGCHTFHKWQVVSGSGSAVNN